MRSIIGVLFLILLFNSGECFAYTPQSGNISVVFGPSVRKTIFDDTRSGIDSTYRSGVGLLILGDANDRGSLEIGTFYMPKLFVREVEGNYLSQSSELLHITLGYRYWPTTFFSASLSFYSAYTIGSPSTEFNNLRPDQQQSTSAEDITEYGFDLSLMLQLWNSGSWGAVLEGRYSQSVTSKTGESANDYSGMIGIHYLLQAKRTKPGQVE